MPSVNLGQCVYWRLGFLGSFPSFSTSSHLFCFFCSPWSSERFLTWITLTAPSCWRPWQLYLALIWLTSLSITLCPTRRIFARYWGLRSWKYWEPQRIAAFFGEQERRRRDSITELFQHYWEDYKQAGLCSSQVQYLHSSRSFWPAWRRTSRRLVIVVFHVFCMDEWAPEKWKVFIGRRKVIE